MAFDWAAANTALQNWVQGGTSLPDSKVIFGLTNKNQPANPFASIRMSGPLVPLGAVDAVEVLDVDEPDAGEEVEHRVLGLRELTVNVDCFTDETRGNNSAAARLSQLMTYTGLPTVRYALRLVGLVPFDVGSVINLSALDDTDFRGRAVLDVRFYLTETVSEFGTYIEHANVTDLSAS